MHTYIHTYRPTYMHALHCIALRYITLHYITLHYVTYIHPYIHASMHPYIHTNIPTHLHPSIHTSIHPCIQIHTCFKSIFTLFLKVYLFILLLFHLPRCFIVYNYMCVCVRVCVCDHPIDGVMGHNCATMTKRELVIVTKRNVETVCARYGNVPFRQVHSQKQDVKLYDRTFHRLEPLSDLPMCLWSFIITRVFSNVFNQFLQVAFFRWQQAMITSRICARIAGTQPI